MNWEWKATPTDFRIFMAGPSAPYVCFHWTEFSSCRPKVTRSFPERGENVTISGLDWSELQAGTRLALGDEVQVELTSYTTPCNTIPQYFVDGKYQRIHQKLHPGWSRIYARVLRNGTLRVGQTVKLLNGDA